MAAQCKVCGFGNSKSLNTEHLLKPEAYLQHADFWYCFIEFQSKQSLNEQNSAYLWTYLKQQNIKSFTRFIDNLELMSFGFLWRNQ